MVQAVLCDITRWTKNGRSTPKIAVNASAAEFRDSSYAKALLTQLSAQKLNAALIEVEITETAFLDAGADRVVSALKELRHAGVTVALDDFGTGFSSLSHLRDLPVDTIKIDRSFVSGLGEAGRDRSITEAILTLGSALGMNTVAEGVETEMQADFLRDHGCTFAQGFLFSPAVKAARVEEDMLQ